MSSVLDVLAGRVGSKLSLLTLKSDCQPSQESRQLQCAAPMHTNRSRVDAGMLHKHSLKKHACTPAMHDSQQFLLHLCRPSNHYAGSTTPQPAAPAANTQSRIMHIAQFSGKVELYKGSVSTVYQAQDDWSGHKVILKCYHKKKMQVGRQPCQPNVQDRCALGAGATCCVRHNAGMMCCTCFPAHRSPRALEPGLVACRTSTTTSSTVRSRPWLL
jgi:hypothetical protein